MEKKEPSFSIVGNVNQCRHYEKQCGGYSKMKNKTTKWYSNSIPFEVLSDTADENINWNSPSRKQFSPVDEELAPVETMIPQLEI